MDYSLASYERPVLVPPGGTRSVLLHICCAVCAGEILEAMIASGLRVTAFFYNPNIHPVDEYEKRKQETLRFVDKLGLESVDADYDSERWFDAVRGYEDAPERGERCRICFEMRLKRTAAYAADHGISVLATTLGISRWKNLEMVNAAGMQAAAPYEGLHYWDYNWRKKGGSQRMSEIARREHFYRQNYCGCVFCLRDAEREGGTGE